MARRTWGELEANLPDNTSGLIDAVHVREALIDSQRPHVEGRPPESTDNASDGFDVGHTWIDSSASPWPEAWRCVYSDTSFAIWARIEGPPGPAGADGVDGASLTPMGEWDDTTTYPANAIVRHGSASWVANAESTNSEPGVGSEWDLLVEDGPPGPGGGIQPGSGIVIAKGGADPDFPDPNPTGITYWLMSVAPNNRKVGDLWLETGAFD